MMRRLRTTALLLAVALAAPSVASVVRAAPDDASKNEAKERYDKGVKLYKDGAYEAALVEFQRAYDLNPSYKILYNIGLILQQLNDFAGAMKAFQRYLSEGKSDVTLTRKVEVDKTLSALRQNVGTVDVQMNVQGAEVKVDDVAVGSYPLPEALLVNAGRRRISATKDDLTDTKVIDIAGGEKATVTLKLVTPPKNGATTSTTATSLVQPPPPPLVTPSKSGTPWVLWSITGGLAITGGVFGILALKSSSTLKNDRDVFGVTHSTLDDQQSKTKQFALIADIAFAGAVVAGGLSLYFTFKSDKEAPKPGAAKTTTTPTTQLGIGPGTVSLAGTF